jgi:hypothetical protein
MASMMTRMMARMMAGMEKGGDEDEDEETGEEGPEQGDASRAGAMSAGALGSEKENRLCDGGVAGGQGRITM